MFLHIIKAKTPEALQEQFQIWAASKRQVYIVNFELETNYFVKDEQTKIDSSWISYNLFIYYDNLSKGEVQAKELRVIVTQGHEAKHENDVNDCLVSSEHAGCSETLISNSCCFRPKKKTGASDAHIYYCTAIIWLT
ncbi:hypothetical protein ACFL1U_03355 [Patescibacteria group bacterium]